MKVTWSGIAIVNATGKLGGTVLQNGRFGYIARIWIKPTVKTVPNFNANDEKNIFRQITSRWRTLTPTQRASWNPALPTGKSGFNYYTSANLIFFRINGSFLDTMPLPRATPVITAPAFSLSSGTQLYTFNFTSGAVLANMNATFFLVINKSAGIANARKSEFRYATTNPIGLGANPYTIGLPSNFPRILAGGRAFLKFVIQDGVTGLASAPQIYTAVAT